MVLLESMPVGLQVTIWSRHNAGALGSDLARDSAVSKRLHIKMALHAMRPPRVNVDYKRREPRSKPMG